MNCQQLLRKQATCSLRPFDERNALRKRISKAELLELCSTFDAVEIKVIKHQRAELVNLNNWKTWAWDFFGAQPGALCQARNKPASQGRLAGPELAGDRNHISPLNQGGKPTAERHGGRFMGQVQSDCGLLHALDYPHAASDSAPCSFQPA